MSIVGVDVGGSGLRARAATDVDRPALSTSLARDTSRDQFLDALAAAVFAVTDDPTDVTIAIPAFVQPDGRLTDCPALPALSDLPLRTAFRQRTGIARINVVPDLSAATIAEHAAGAGRGIDRFLGVAIGTGVNAAAIVHGRPVETAFGCLGDAGHVNVDPDGPDCPCGGRGCLEAVASGYALARDGQRIGQPDARAVTAAAERGDPDAIALLAAAGRALGRAMATWSALLWPQRIAVAGGVAGAGELLLGPARRELHRVGTPYIVTDIDVVAAELGAEATLIGACHLAREAAERSADSR